MTARLVLLSLSAALVVAAPALACAERPDREAAEAAEDARRFELAQAHAGEPVKTVRFLRPIHSYEVIDPQAVLVWETPFKAWLVDLRKSAACHHLDQGFAVGIDVRSDTLNTSNGYITGENGIRCKMEQIREVDVTAMKAAERAADGSDDQS